MANLFKIKPVNRHLTIVPHISKKETNSGVLLPEDYSFEEDRYISATLVDAALDCSACFLETKRADYNDRTIIVDRTMVEEINLKDKTFYIILENYVVALMRRGTDEG